MSFTIWFSGLSGAGKTTIAQALITELKKSHTVIHLDGDQLRHGLSSDLGFSNIDRLENVRRAAHLSKLLNAQDTISVVSMITPLEIMREKVRTILSTIQLLEVFVDCPLEICIKRDPKGLYQRALNGESNNMTGIQAEFEIPANPQVIVKTDQYQVEESVSLILEELQKRKLI